MYILLSGKPPYSGKNDKDILEKVETGVLEFIGKLLLFYNKICTRYGYGP